MGTGRLYYYEKVLWKEESPTTYSHLNRKESKITFEYINIDEASPEKVITVTVIMMTTIMMKINTGEKFYLTDKVKTLVQQWDCKAHSHRKTKFPKMHHFRSHYTTSVNVLWYSATFWQEGMWKLIKELVRPKQRKKTVIIFSHSCCSWPVPYLSYFSI